MGFFQCCRRLPEILILWDLFGRHNPSAAPRSLVECYWQQRTEPPIFNGSLEECIPSPTNTAKGTHRLCLRRLISPPSLEVGCPHLRHPCRSCERKIRNRQRRMGGPNAQTKTDWQHETWILRGTFASSLSYSLMRPLLSNRARSCGTGRSL